jgi:hypothetical protein
VSHLIYLYLLYCLFSTKIELKNIPYSFRENKKKNDEVWRLYDLAHRYYQPHDPAKWPTRDVNKTDRKYFKELRALLVKLVPGLCLSSFLVPCSHSCFILGLYLCHMWCVTDIHRNS